LIYGSPQIDRKVSGILFFGSLAFEATIEKRFDLLIVLIPLIEKAEPSRYIFDLPDISPERVSEERSPAIRAQPPMGKEWGRMQKKKKYGI